MSCGWPNRGRLHTCSVGKVDAEGDNRYYIDASGNLIEKADWQEVEEDV